MAASTLILHAMMNLIYLCRDAMDRIASIIPIHKIFFFFFELPPNPSWFHLTTTSFDSPHHRWPSSITEIRYYLLISKISWMAEEIWIDRVVLELKEKMKFVDETPSHLRDDYFQAGLMADYSRS